GDVRSFLERHGWTCLGSSGSGERWKRPNGDRPSATLFEDSRKFYVFSTNAAPLEHDRAYSPFALIATLDHAGDFQAAARALAAEGYGAPPKRRLKHEPKPTSKHSNGQKKSQVGNIKFNTDEKGVWASDEDGTAIWICSKLVIEASIRDEDNGSWGRLLKFP